MTFPVALRRDVVNLAEQLRVGRAQHLLDLGLRPDVELALLALAVGIQRGGKTAALGNHFGQQPAHCLLDAHGIERVGSLPPGLAHQVDQQRVVVEHLLEVRGEPALVDGVARETAAEVVVDAALADVGERDVDGVPGGLVAVADGATPQQPEEAPLREFRRALQSAASHVDGVDHAQREVS